MSQYEQWRNWQGHPRPFPTDLIKSDHAAEAARLWATVEQRRSHVHDVEAAHKRAEQAVRDAQVAYESEVQRAAQAGEVSTRDAELRSEWERLVRELEPSDAGPLVHYQRRYAAVSLAEASEADYLAFVTQHSDEFLSVLAPACEKAAAEWISVNDANYKRLRPVELRHGELRDAVQLVIGADTRFSESDLPPGNEYQRPPLPVEALARIEEERHAAEHGADADSLPES
jgi:hypothetical protein